MALLAPDTEQPAAGEVTQVAHVLKVDQAKVDALMNLIAELVVSKNSLPFLARRAEDIYGSRDMGREIKVQYAVIDRLAQEMQRAIMDVRMLPVSEVFERFPRLVRDLSRKLNKHIELKVIGGETAADKTIIESLGDPLIHLVRNAIDHGVEFAEQRAAAGKPEAATIQLKAFQERDQVVIEVSDDGKGIDPTVIRLKAFEKGMIAEDRVDTLSDQEAINLIFLPGFSTNEEVSDLSGRGVGLDVVRTAVEKFRPGHSLVPDGRGGSIVRLSLPLSMAVARVMMVEVGDTVLGVPMDGVAETVRVAQEQYPQDQARGSLRAPGCHRAAGAHACLAGTAAFHGPRRWTRRLSWWLGSAAAWSAWWSTGSARVSTSSSRTPLEGMLAGMRVYSDRRCWAMAGCCWC